MYEYLQVLHQCFFREPEHTDLHDEIEKLRLLDVQGYLKNDVSLESFAAHFPERRGFPGTQTIFRASFYTRDKYY